MLGPFTAGHVCLYQHSAPGVTYKLSQPQELTQSPARHTTGQESELYFIPAQVTALKKTARVETTLKVETHTLPMPQPQPFPHTAATTSQSESTGGHGGVYVSKES